MTCAFFEDRKNCFPFAAQNNGSVMINKLAIFCGSKMGNHSLYEQHAIALANLLAQKKIELIYGGGRNGLMGVVANTVMKQGGIVRGVIPQVLVDWEHQHDEISELFVVDNMHVRKGKLYDLCDGAIILPGGFGTLDEFFEILTWNQLSLHDKKIFIMNSGGFYDHLLAHTRLLSEEGFLYGNLEEKFTVLNDPSELENYLA